MPNLEVQPGWPAARQLDRDEFASGGPDGNLNEHAKVFLARTEYLQQQKANKSEIVQGIHEFGTYAEFDAYKATLPVNCTVVIGEENTTGTGQWGLGNNRWNGTVLKKSEFDPAQSAIQHSESYTKQKVSDVQNNIDSLAEKVPYGEDILNIVDEKDNIVAKLSVNGLLYLVGITDDLSVQEIIEKLNERANSKDSQLSEDASTDIYVVTDLNNNIVLKINKSGDVFIPNIEKDIASEILQLKQSSGVVKDTVIAQSRNRLHNFDPSTSSFLLASQFAETGVKCPPPLNLYKHDFIIDDSFLSSIDAFGKADSTLLTINTPYGLNQGSCHPSLIEFYNGFLGYKYLCAITPYHNTQESQENPCIYGSNDLENFELLDGFTQPLDVPPPSQYNGHNSDNVLAHDPRTGELICVYRQSRRNSNGSGLRTDCLWMRKTKDGKNWTEPKRIMLNLDYPESELCGSPCLIYNTNEGCWDLYIDTLNRSWSRNSIRLFKNQDLDNETGWTFVSDVVTPSFANWHMDIKYIGKTLVMLCYSMQDQGLYFGASNDGINFTFSENIFNGTAIYKASFVPVFDSNNHLSLDILYSSDDNDSAGKWRMFHKRTNFINANVSF